MGLDYVAAYHLRCQITLDSGRPVTFESLDQVQTYAGLIEGVPWADTNDWLIEGCLKGLAKRYEGSGFRPILIPPRRRDFLREPGDMANSRGPGGRPVEWLPMVRCNALLKSLSMTGGRSGGMSCLVVAWFQDEFAFPIDDAALGAIRALDWERLATDVSWDDL